MKMLLLKAWTETRVRFFSSLLAATVVCLYHITQHAWLVTLWKQTFATDPKALTHFPWMPLGISSYDWYLWHYLFDNYLQQLWVLFAVLFAFGGLAREKLNGTAPFSLGLPISRRRWLLSRLLVVLIESIALAVFAIGFTAIASIAIHQSFSMAELVLHTVLMVATGIFFIALGNLCSALFPGEYLAIILTLLLFGTPYLIVQTYEQHMRVLGRGDWLRNFDLAHIMAGPWQLTWATLPWLGMAFLWTMTALLLIASIKHGDRIDY